MAWAQGYKKKNCAHYTINENHYRLYFLKLCAVVAMIRAMRMATMACGIAIRYRSFTDSSST